MGRPGTSSRLARRRKVVSLQFVALTTLNTGSGVDRYSTRSLTGSRSAAQGTKDLWAPDVSYENHEYRMYYAYSLFGKNTSGIALAVNKTLDPTSPDFKWIDKGLVLESKAEDNFNAIDPNFIRDHKGQDWLAFGSFWDGIKMRRLDKSTGLLSFTDTTLYSLARRAQPPDAAPAPPGLPPELGGHRSAIHRVSWRLLLLVYVVGSLLPWSEEHLQDDRRTREGCHRSVSRPDRQTPPRGRRNAAVGWKLPLARTGRRERVDGT